MYSMKFKMATHDENIYTLSLAIKEKFHFGEQRDITH